jgi:DNA polymerase zeta
MVKDSADSLNLRLSLGAIVDEEDSELDLINRLTDIVREFDPDILSGYEVQSSSWGYVIERARLQFGKPSLSRI